MDPGCGPNNLTLVALTEVEVNAGAQLCAFHTRTLLLAKLQPMVLQIGSDLIGPAKFSLNFGLTQFPHGDSVASLQMALAATWGPPTQLASHPKAGPRRYPPRADNNRMNREA